MDHLRRRPHDDGHPQRQLRRRDLQRPQPGPLVLEPDGGNHVRGSRGSFGIDLGPPFHELRLQIGVVQKAALFEERSFDPAHQVFDRSFLTWALGPADLDPNPQIERDTSEQWIPFRDPSAPVPFQRDRLGAIEDGEQRNAADRGEVIHPRAHERLGPLVRHEGHFHPPRILQP